MCVQVPVQSNDWDCGLFILHYAEEFAKDPTMVIDRVRSKEVAPCCQLIAHSTTSVHAYMPHKKLRSACQTKCLENWFKSGFVQKNKRNHVKGILDQLSVVYEEGLAASKAVTQ